MLRIDSNEKLIQDGLRALDAANYSLALAKFDEAGGLGAAQTPQFSSAYAVCLAALKEQHDHAASLCHWSIEMEPCESIHYLQLGRVYLLADDRKKALHVFREGILYRRDVRILKELENLGVRRPPFFSTLPRGHFLNRFVGRMMNRFART